jgi:threonine dehydrogenase-like Zn-dependent dehydrogenase
MRALVLKAPKTLAVMDVPEMRPGPGQVILRVSKCGICGSDIRYFCGENPWAKQTLGKEIPNPPNIILGHEFVGVVVRSVRSGMPGSSANSGRPSFIAGDTRSARRTGKPVSNTTSGPWAGLGQDGVLSRRMAQPVSPSAARCMNRKSDRRAGTFLDPMIAALHAVDGPTQGP